MVINVFCGVVSGVLSSSLANPTDVLKVSLETLMVHLQLGIHCNVFYDLDSRFSVKLVIFVFDSVF